MDTWVQVLEFLSRGLLFVIICVGVVLFVDGILGLIFDEEEEARNDRS